jgi:hypothetical protein
MSGSSEIWEINQKTIRLSLVQLYSVLRHNYQDPSMIISLFNENVKNSSFGLLTSIVNYQALLSDYSEIVMANYSITRILSRKYHRKFTLEEARSVTLESLQDPEVEKNFYRFEKAWTNLIPKYLQNHPDVFSFAFMCAQNFDANAIKDLILAQGLKTPVFQFLLVDRQDCQDADSLFMKAVIGSLIKHLHNKLIDLSLEVRGLKGNSAKEDSDSIKLEHCSESSFVKSIDYTSAVLKNYYFRTEVEHENKLVFDLASIEAECSKLITFRKILVEEGDLLYYSFKYSKKTENLGFLNKLRKKLSETTLHESIKTELNRLEDTEVKTTIDFLLEVAEPVLLNHLYDSPHTSLAEVVESLRVDRPARLRLDNLYVGQIPALYAYLTASAMESQLQTPLSEDQQKSLEQLNNNQLTALVDEIAETYQEFAENKDLVIKTAIKDVLDLDHLPASIGNITFGQLGSLQRELKQRKDRTVTVESSTLQTTAVRKTPISSEMEWENM